jgi:hypothetical protein
MPISSTVTCNNDWNNKLNVFLTSSSCNKKLYLPILFVNQCSYHIITLILQLNTTGKPTGGGEEKKGGKRDNSKLSNLNLKFLVPSTSNK